MIEQSKHKDGKICGKEHNEKGFEGEMEKEIQIGLETCIFIWPTKRGDRILCCL